MAAKKKTARKKGTPDPFKIPKADPAEDRVEFDGAGVDPRMTLQDEKQVVEIAIADLFPDPENSKTARHEGLGDIDGLAATIQKHGVLQPLVVRKDPSGCGYMIVFGERRWAASKKAGLDTVPCVVVAGDGELADLRLVENLHRKDPHVLDELAVYQRLAGGGMEPRHIAGQCGVTPRRVAHVLALNNLPKSGAKMLRDGAMDERAAVAIARLHDPKDRTEAVKLARNWLRNGRLDSSGFTDALTRTFCLRIKDAPFPNKVPIGDTVACVDCPLATHNERTLFADLDDTSRCTSSSCWDDKRAAWWREVTEKKKAEGDKVLNLKESDKKIVRYGGGSIGLYHGSKFVMGKDKPYEDPKNRTWTTLLKGSNLKITWAAPPAGAQPIALYDDRAAKKYVRDEFGIGKRGSANTTPSMETKRRREIKIRRDYLTNALPSMRLRANEVYKNTDGNLLRLVIGRLISHIADDGLRRILPSHGAEPPKRDGHKSAADAFRELVASLPDDQLPGIVVELAATDGAFFSHSTVPKHFTETAKALGVDLAKAKRDANKANPTAAQKAAARKKEAAAKKKAKKKATKKAAANK